MTNKIAAYKDLLKVVKKHSEAFDRENVTLSPEHLKSVVEAMEVSERFGIPLKRLQTGSYLEVKNAYDEWTGLGFYSEGAVGCSDTGEQPKGEWLLRMRFGCGAYSFTSGYPSDNNYPVKTFNDFFNELKSYNPAYCDTANSTLYFRDDVAKVVYDDFWMVFNKYKALVQDELKEKQKQKLRDELARLEIQ